MTAADDRLRAQAMLMAEAEHRLKTSLAVITGWASTLEDRWDQLDDERRRDAVRIIRRASEGLAAQTQSLLVEARAEIVSLDAIAVELDLDAVLAATTTDFGGASQGAVVHLAAGGPVPALVDPASLQQVLGHLIENAVTHSPPGTDVSVRARLDGSEAVLEVVDTGKGIPDDVDIFLPFHRGPDAEEGTGVGLGLYIVRNLVRAMSGSVTASRNPDGPGSTFAVRLPRP